MNDEGRGILTLIPLSVLPVAWLALEGKGGEKQQFCWDLRHPILRLTSPGEGRLACPWEASRPFSYQPLSPSCPCPCPQWPVPSSEPTQVTAAWFLGGHTGSVAPATWSKSPSPEDHRFLNCKIRIIMPGGRVLLRLEKALHTTHRLLLSW